MKVPDYKYDRQLWECHSTHNSRLSYIVMAPIGHMSVFTCNTGYT